jgi:hypothetical protein
MKSNLEIGYSNYHGWYVKKSDVGVIANGFASKEAAERTKKSIEITDQYIGKFKKGDLIKPKENYKKIIKIIENTIIAVIATLMMIFIILNHNAFI